MPLGFTSLSQQCCHLEHGGALHFLGPRVAFLRKSHSHRSEEAASGWNCPSGPRHINGVKTSRKSKAVAPDCSRSCTSPSCPSGEVSRREMRGIPVHEWEPTAQSWERLVQACKRTRAERVGVSHFLHLVVDTVAIVDQPSIGNCRPNQASTFRPMWLSTSSTPRHSRESAAVQK